MPFLCCKNLSTQRFGRRLGSVKGATQREQHPCGGNIDLVTQGLFEMLPQVSRSAGVRHGGGPAARTYATP